MRKNLFVLLGAQDPEMRESEAVLRKLNIPYGHLVSEGVRCNAKSAYAGESVGLAELGKSVRRMVLPPKADIITLECALPGLTPAVAIDHHNPGDSGYTVQPDNYLAGSSLGQLLTLLEMDPTETQRLLAAGDHCLTAAYQGRCPGVDPDELLFLRAAWQAKIMNTSLYEVIDAIQAAATAVRARLDGATGVSSFLDPTRVPAAIGEGSAYAGIAVRYRSLSPSGTVKEMLKGGTPAQIEAFMHEHQQYGRLVYGNPYRGYAGAYL